MKIKDSCLTQKCSNLKSLYSLQIKQKIDILNYNQPLNGLKKTSIHYKNCKSFNVTLQEDDRSLHEQNIKMCIVMMNFITFVHSTSFLPVLIRMDLHFLS